MSSARPLTPRSFAWDSTMSALSIAEHAHYDTIPWCAAQLSIPGTRALVPVSRLVKTTGEDQIFSRTLNTKDTVSHFLIFYVPPAIAPQTLSFLSSSPGLYSLVRAGKASVLGVPPVTELKAFLTLDRGLNGFPGVVHGGLVTTMLDEILGLLLGLNKDRGALPTRRVLPDGREEDVWYMTAYLNTKYVAPVRTPSTVLAVARNWRVEGRKVWIDGEICDEDGNTLTKAEALFVGLRAKI